MNIANCSNSRYAVQPVYARADKPLKRELRQKQKHSFIQALMPQGFPTNYAQLVISVFFLGSFLGENVINPIAATIGKRPAALAVTTIFVVAATIISQMNAQAMSTVVKALQVMAVFAGVVSLLYSIYGGASVVPFHELVNSGAAAKNLLLILLVGIVLGSHSAQIKTTLLGLSAKYLSHSTVMECVRATAFDAKQNILQPASQVDKVNLDMVSSDEYLFSSLYE